MRALSNDINFLKAWVLPTKVLPIIPGAGTPVQKWQWGEYWVHISTQSFKIPFINSFNGNNYSHIGPLTNCRSEGTSRFYYGYVGPYDIADYVLIIYASGLYISRYTWMPCNKFTNLHPRKKMPLIWISSRHRRYKYLQVNSKWCIPC